MNEGNSEMNHIEQAPEAQVQTKRSFSIIWVVPIIALLIGGWLTFKAMSEAGPTITISFESADGLEANKTKIKFKDVDVGKVVSLELKDDLSGVVATVEMEKSAKLYMKENTRFWVVRARVAAGEVSGLGTLFSGAYIGCAPSLEGKNKSEFTGLEKPPIMTETLPGRHFVLSSKTLGSLDLGSPIYYRGIKVGKVVEYNFDENAEAVLMKVFIGAPYHEKVRENTRFWNASGIDFSMDSTGIKMDTQSLISIMTGGLAFGLRQHDRPGEQAEANKSFMLYANKDESNEETYTVKHYFMMYFDQSARGLSPGAPVEVMGIKIGEVVKVELEFEQQSLTFRIPVLIMIEPERLDSLRTMEGKVVSGGAKDQELEAHRTENSDTLAQTKALIAKGFRAQLKTGNLLTGQLYVDLDYYPDAPLAELTMERGYPVFPTTPAPLEQIVSRVNKILKKVDRILQDVEKIPFDKIGEDVQVAVESLSTTLNEFAELSGSVNKDTVPKINDSLDKLQKTIDGMNATFGTDSALGYNARKVTDELSLTIRSIRSLTEYLESNPKALIFGKEGEKK